MTGWFASRRRLQAEVAYLRLQLKEERSRPQLVVRPGPPPAPVESEGPVDVVTILRGQVRVLRLMTTVPGARELAREVRTWRDRAALLAEQLSKARAESEGLERELQALRAPGVTMPSQREPGLG
ncbi:MULTISPECIES: hypothetical protein [unclassified Streptomyces]|uniref:hypothetical protein n=1 Tax=unclassified Streptomyces TaxID=2593676 RepID=UPI00364B7DE5